MLDTFPQPRAEGPSAESVRNPRSASKRSALVYSKRETCYEYSAISV